jgi:hypothetical protein
LLPAQTAFFTIDANLEVVLFAGRDLGGHEDAGGAGVGAEEYGTVVVEGAAGDHNV